MLSPYDGLSRGIITALQNAGYPDTVADGFPVVTGQDAEIASVKLIADDVQFASIFKDTRKLAAQAVMATEEYLKGNEPTANDTDHVRERRQDRPLVPARVGHRLRRHIQSLLVDSGYWTAEEVASGVACLSIARASRRRWCRPLGRARHHRAVGQAASSRSTEIGAWPRLLRCRASPRPSPA